ncbi:MAG: molybdenum cofactor guanylyltransferase [Bryobacteraceae bacterium]|nr:molybdenum cofactor guanylyltransferase [Bryobacteraceae bacterium]
MSRAGFVLAGGQSSRMGRDKALLPYRDSVLVSWIARQVELAAGGVTLVGAPERYACLALPALADLRPGCGPLGGIETALTHTRADWNVVVACDMPGLTAPLLEDLLARAERADCDCLLPLGPDGRDEPLCAVWHRRSLAAVRAALDANRRKVTEALRSLCVARVPAGDAGWAANMNTPAEWESHAADQ